MRRANHVVEDRFDHGNFPWRGWIGVGRFSKPARPAVVIVRQGRQGLPGLPGLGMVMGAALVLAAPGRVHGEAKAGFVPKDSGRGIDARHGSKKGRDSDEEAIACGPRRSCCWGWGFPRWRPPRMILPARRQRQPRWSAASASTAPLECGQCGNCKAARAKGDCQARLWEWLTYQPLTNYKCCKLGPTTPSASPMATGTSPAWIHRAVPRRRLRREKLRLPTLKLIRVCSCPCPSVRPGSGSEGSRPSPPLFSLRAANRCCCQNGCHKVASLLSRSATSSPVALQIRKTSAMQTEFLNPPTLCPTVGWTHVVAVTGAKTIYISGQVSVNARGEVVGKGDLRAQTEQTFENLKHALAAAGATFRDVVKSNLYVVGLKPEHVPILREVRSRYFNPAQPQRAPWSESPRWSAPTG